HGWVSSLRASETRGRRTLEDDPPAARVHEAESRGVQTDPLERIALAPVRTVADDRMPECRELGADLAPPPRHESDLEQRRAPAQAPSRRYAVRSRSVSVAIVRSPAGFSMTTRCSSS